MFSDGNLVILVHGGGEIVLQNFGAQAAGDQIPPLNFAGDVVSAFDLLSQTASAEQLADIQPAAGPGAGGGGLTGGAAFGPFDPAGYKCSGVFLLSKCSCRGSSNFHAARTSLKRRNH